MYCICIIRLLAVLGLACDKQSNDPSIIIKSKSCYMRGLIVFGSRQTQKRVLGVAERPLALRLVMIIKEAGDYRLES